MSQNGCIHWCEFATCDNEAKFKIGQGFYCHLHAQLITAEQEEESDD